MAREIERKFLTVGDPLPEATKSMRLIQGYLARENDVAVRVRITDDAHALIGHQALALSYREGGIRIQYSRRRGETNDPRDLWKSGH